MTTKTMTTQNTELTLAEQFIRLTNQNIFLTGKAGTGKTTFLHNLQKHPPKRMIVTAPTGVAAINARGMTIHSFFQLPFGPFVPGNEVHQQSTQHRFTKQKINIIRTLELLVIDEISMVRADVLDAIDFVLQRYKGSELPFGGVQLLMIGDLHQLSPVIKNDERSILMQHYNSCYFFGSNALQKTDFQTIELKHIYRQSDQTFIQLLNQVRENKIDRETLNLLNTRYQADLDHHQGNHYITLTTHNKIADQINDSQLNALSSKSFTFHANIKDTYPEYAYPTSVDLVLKKQAQVMFVRNDASPEKRYYNGKIGRVTHIGNDYISVMCEGDEKSIQVEISEWDNVKYSIDEQTKEIKEEIIGSFSQYPLRLAWAITIHKSQGLTFEKVIIDADAAFAHGQVYVALSRCRTFEGIVLRKPIPATAVRIDRQVSEFASRAEETAPTEQRLNSAKITYQQQQMIECFNFQPLKTNLLKISKLIRPNAKLIQLLASDSLDNVFTQVTTDIIEVSEKFQRQLSSLFTADETPESNAFLQERIQKAAQYFSEKLDQVLHAWVASLKIESDNKELSKKTNQSLNFLRQTLATKQATMSSCKKGFSTSHYIRARALADINNDKQINYAKQTHDNKVQVEYEASDIEHPALLNALKAWRTQKAKSEQLEAYRILHHRILIQIAILLPTSTKALKNIKGIGDITAEKYGEALISIVDAYSQTTQPTPVEDKAPENSLSKPAIDSHPIQV